MTRRLPLLGVLATGVLIASACVEVPPIGPPPPTPRPLATPTVPPATPVPSTRAPTAAPTPSRPPTPRPAAAAGPAVERSDVRKMAQAWTDATSYRMHAQAAASPQAVDMTLEEVKPDRRHLKLQMGSQTFEVIQIGADTYANVYGPWIRTPAGVPLPTSQLINPDDLVKGFDDAAALGRVTTKGGLTTVDGAPCQEWTQSAPDGVATVTFCVGTADNLPRRMDVTSPSSGLVTVTFSDWNAPISIEAPI